MSHGFRENYSKIVFVYPCFFYFFLNCFPVYTGHTDSVRAGCMNPTSPHMIISGSNDKTVRLWDSRTGTTVVHLDHGSLHVNDVVCHPQGQVGPNSYYL